MTRGRLQTDDNRLERRCLDWIAGIRGEFGGTRPPAQQARRSPPNFKMA